MPSLTWKHHALIQSLLSRGPLLAVDFHKIFESVTGRNPGAHENLFNEYLLAINKKLSFVQFELRGCRNQYDGKVYYGVVNNVADEQSKFGSKYSVPQIAFYKGIIERIVQDSGSQGSISNNAALYIRLEDQVPTNTQSQLESQAGTSAVVPPAFKNFSMSQKEKTLEELVKDRWLCSTSDGRIGLGVRSFLDLRSWFHNNEVHSCHICNEAAVKAEQCPNEGCAVRIHSYCLAKKYSQRKVEKVCPGCSSQWPYAMTKEEMLEYQDELDEPVPTTQPNERSRGKRRIAPSTQPSQQSRGKKRILEDAENVPSGPRKSLRRSVITDDADDTASSCCSSPAPPLTRMPSILRRSTRSTVRLR